MEEARKWGGEGEEGGGERGGNVNGIANITAVLGIAVIMSVPWDKLPADPISSGQRFRGIEKLLSTERLTGLTFNEIRPDYPGRRLESAGIFFSEWCSGASSSAAV